MSHNRASDQLIETTLQIIEIQEEQLRSRDLVEYADEVHRCFEKLTTLYVAGKFREIERLAQKSA